MNNDYYMYRQEELAKKVLSSGFQTGYYNYEMKLASLYLRDIEGLKPSAIEARIIELCKKSINDYSERGWCMRIRDAMKYAANKEHRLVQCDSVPVYQHEVAYIKGLDVDENVKRTVLAMMVQKKLDKISFETQHGGEYSIFTYSNGTKRFKSLPKTAGIKTSKGFDFCLDVLYPMREKGLIDIIQTTGSPLKLNFNDQICLDGDVAVLVRDYSHIGLYYDYLFIDDNRTGFCEICGFPFKRAMGRGRVRKYCDEHRDGYVHTGIYEEGVCEDCGALFVRTKGNAAKQVRCDVCQYRHKLESKRKQARC